MVAFAYIVDRLRRLPGARRLSPVLPWVAGGLFIVAIAIVFMWGTEASPQRMSLSGLAAGQLSPMQSWIIVDGVVSAADGGSAGEFRYTLTDPAVPNATLDVHSPVALALGRTTVSGHLLGGREVVPAGYLWSAILRADPTLAQELPPPWAPVALIVAGLVILLGRRTTYPVFLDERPDPAGLRAASIPVQVRRADGETDHRVTPSTLRVAFDGGPLVTLAASDADPVPVRAHSAFTSVGVGALRTLVHSEPVLRVRASGEELTIGFGSRADRDAAYAALSAEAKARTGVNST